MDDERLSISRGFLFLHRLTVLTMIGGWFFIIPSQSCILFSLHKQRDNKQPISTAQSSDPQTRGKQRLIKGSVAVLTFFWKTDNVNSRPTSHSHSLHDQASVHHLRLSSFSVTVRLVDHTSSSLLHHPNTHTLLLPWCHIAWGNCSSSAKKRHTTVVFSFPYNHQCHKLLLIGRKPQGQPLFF